MSQDKDFLGTEPIGKLLVRLAMPTVAAQLINMLYNIVDRIYIGHIPQVGSLALTGVGVCMSLILIVSAFAALVGSGGAPRASIFLGQQNREAAEETLGNCFTMQLVISALLTAALLVWNRPLLLLFGASENTIGYATAYMNLYAVGTVFVQLTLGMNMFITAQGNTKTSMWSVLIGAISNIILDPIFIFALDLGVQGAALATILSQAFSCIWVLCFLFGKKTVLKIRPQYLFLRSSVIFPCLLLGLSVFIMQASEGLIQMCFNASLLKYGGDMAVGAMTILSSVMMLATLPSQGLSQGAQPILSYNFGARRPDRVKKAYYLLRRCSLGYTLTFWAVVTLFPRVFAAIFTPDTALLDFTQRALRVFIGGVGIFGIQMSCQMAFTSLGNAKASILTAVTRKFILLIPLIYILPLIFTGNQTMAVYLAEPVADILAVIFTTCLFRGQFKKSLASITD